APGAARRPAQQVAPAGGPGPRSCSSARDSCTVAAASMVGIRTAALITVVLIAAQPARAADRFPFEIQNGRGASGLVFSVAAELAAPTRWKRTVRIVRTEDVAVSTEPLT